jgi:hypothetical protein
MIASRFDHILIDYSVADSGGAKFWKTCFLEKVDVDWQHFAAGLEQYFELAHDDEHLRFLRALLSMKQRISNAH